MKKVSSTLAAKLYGAFALSLTVTLIISAFSVYQVREIDRALASANTLREEALEPLYVAREALDQTGIAARNAFIFSDTVAKHRELQELDRQRKIYLNAVLKLEESIGRLSQFAVVRAGLKQMAVELDRPRKYIVANDHDGYGAFLVDECTPLRRKIVADIETLLQQLQTQTREANSIAQSEGETAQLWIVILTSACAVVSALVSTVFTRQLLRQLGGEPTYAVEVAKEIAVGNLRNPVMVSDACQESVINAMSTMQQNLAAIVGKVRSGTDAIASASAEIARGNSDLSVRTENQATEVGRINSVMKTLSTSIANNANSAADAATVAGKAEQVSLKGGVAVDSVVLIMGQINEASCKIVDIISVIDGIASQTNILALNAAVEAARAGEQGRGFAVVASEVRSLAQRSATAAKEIKSLIEDSVDKVKIGTEVVENAGITMKDVVDHVQRVSCIMVEITNATTEQTQEVAMIEKATAYLDDMTLQNTALVEEAAAAAQSLREQAEELSDVVSAFKLTEAHSTTQQRALLAY